MAETTRRPKFQLYTILLGWLGKFGIESLDSMITLTPEEIHKILTKIHKDIVKKPKPIKAILNKKKQAMTHIISLDPDDDKFKKCMLEFINGKLSSEFGVRIGKRSNNEDTYILHNPYVKKKDFPRFAIGQDASYIPKLIGPVSLDYDSGDETSDGEDIDMVQ
jgi:hypothetical protein